jgi:hypothetical protein
MVNVMYCICIENLVHRNKGGGDAEETWQPEGRDAGVTWQGGKGISMPALDAGDKDGALAALLGGGSRRPTVRNGDMRRRIGRGKGGRTGARRRDTTMERRWTCRSNAGGHAAQFAWAASSSKVNIRVEEEIVWSSFDAKQMLRMSRSEARLSGGGS